MATSEARRRRPEADRHSGIEELTPLILEWLGEQGIDAMIRVDTLRMSEGRPAWTFLASNGPVEGGLRADGASAAECMDWALVRLREIGVEVPF
ncbi:hypothetical protein ACH4OW_09405 [Streptomyces sp. NPDC017056]|uniref:hypothetical protein n=1 Tax=Streptomyces sp. NPDC017056 TaxID=3364973 RepID=UPI0037B1C670